MSGKTVFKPVVNLKKNGLHLAIRAQDEKTKGVAVQ